MKIAKKFVAVMRLTFSKKQKAATNNRDLSLYSIPYCFFIAWYCFSALETLPASRS